MALLMKVSTQHKYIHTYIVHTYVCMYTSTDWRFIMIMLYHNFLLWELWALMDSKGAGGSVGNGEGALDSVPSGTLTKGPTRPPPPNPMVVVRRKKKKPKKELSLQTLKRRTNVSASFLWISLLFFFVRPVDFLCVTYVIYRIFIFRQT